MTKHDTEVKNLSRMEIAKPLASRGKAVLPRKRLMWMCQNVEIVVAFSRLD